MVIIGFDTIIYLSLILSSIQNSVINKYSVESILKIEILIYKNRKH